MGQRYVLQVPAPCEAAGTVIDKGGVNINRLGRGIEDMEKATI